MLLKLPADAAKIVSGMTPWSRAQHLEGGDRRARRRRCGGDPRWRVASAAQQRKLDTLLYAKLLRAIPTSAAPTSTA